MIAVFSCLSFFIKGMSILILFCCIINIAIESTHVVPLKGDNACRAGETNLAMDLFSEEPKLHPKDRAL